jgi:hypothetical protein
VRLSGRFRAIPNAGKVLDAQQRLDALFRTPVEKKTE